MSFCHQGWDLPCTNRVPPPNKKQTPGSVLRIWKAPLSKSCPTASRNHINNDNKRQRHNINTRPTTNTIKQNTRKRNNIHTRHILPPSEIDLGLFLVVAQAQKERNYFTE